MIVVDTNVLSEVMRPGGSEAVYGWMDQRVGQNLYTTTISQAEILSGLAMMPEGKRRSGMQEAANWMFEQDFKGAILPFDGVAVQHFAVIMASRRLAGRQISFQDAAIIAIARAHGAAVATRNMRDFDDCGVRLHNPWEDTDQR